MQRLDVKVGRFAVYRDVLAQAATTFTSPRARPWLGSDERDLLFYEAASQCRQIVDSFDVWRWQNPEVVRLKLREICSGLPLPPPPPDSDHPRNTLAELACAGLLKRKGFDCDFSQGDEDVVAVLDGLMPFAVEAKRPAHMHSLANNAKSVRRQLGKRTEACAKLGLAVFAADRILGLAGGDFVLERADHLDAVLNRRVEDIVRALQQPTHRLFPRAALGAVLTTGAVFCVDPGFIVTIGSLGFFCTGPEEHPVSRQLHHALKGVTDHTHTMRPRQPGGLAAA